MYNLNDYDYRLPEAYIAQFPETERTKSRLLRLDRSSGRRSHHAFFNIADLLSEGDLLVLNNTEVIPGRLLGHKKTGGKIEVLIIDYPAGKQNADAGGDFECTCLIKASKRPKPGTLLLFDEGLTGRVRDAGDNTYTVRFTFGDNFDGILSRIGHVPLPPYIKRQNGQAPCHDREAYQTVYAAEKGAIAAPTAGLHFSEKLLETLNRRGISTVEITLHVGYGTFLPVRSDDIRKHRMHAEHFSVSEDTAAAVNAARKEGRRIIAVGTTCVRTLEYAADRTGHLVAGTGRCDLFIYPGYAFNIVDAMVTNFHLPKSTLLMLVSAFAGRDHILAAYREAIKEHYRFYSYGDAMLIL